MFNVLESEVVLVEYMGGIHPLLHLSVDVCIMLLDQNSLWHADGNHKVICYRLVVHGTIDGFSRLVTFLECGDNNRSDTVLRHFQKATSEYGVPSRIRTDKGGEIVELWRYMEHVRGEGRSSYITGSSVHNCRIERLWRDIRSNVLETFRTTFHTLEDSGVLDPDNETDIFCLHYVYIPRINQSLAAFQHAWNSHPLSTECNWSPAQSFTAYSLATTLFNDELSVDPQLYGINFEENVEELDESYEAVSIPITHSPLSSLEMQFLQSQVDPLQSSASYGTDLYLKTVFWCTR